MNTATAIANPSARLDISIDFTYLDPSGAASSFSPANTMRTKLPSLAEVAGAARLVATIGKARLPVASGGMGLAWLIPRCSMDWNRDLTYGAFSHDTSRIVGVSAGTMMDDGHIGTKCVHETRGCRVAVFETSMSPDSITASPDGRWLVLGQYIGVGVFDLAPVIEAVTGR